MKQPARDFASAQALMPAITHYISDDALRQFVQAARNEDVGRGDVTTDLLVPRDLEAAAVLRSRSKGVVAGLDIAALVFTLEDGDIDVKGRRRDGNPIAPGDDLAVITGPAHALLRAERVALNLLQRLSGIATLTARYVAAVAGTTARIVDTRKTTPGLRALEKYAVRVGGGHNHRRDLSDAMLVKDNHLVAIAASGLTLTEALRRARAVLPHTMKIEVEVDRLDQIEAALDGGADIILLDNMGPDQLRRAVELIGGRALTEASGGVNLQSVRAIAESGVDLISVGALTHSAPALDIGLDFEWDLTDHA